MTSPVKQHPPPWRHPCAGVEVCTAEEFKQQNPGGAGARCSSSAMQKGGGTLSAAGAGNCALCTSACRCIRWCQLLECLAMSSSVSTQGQQLFLRHPLRSSAEAQPLCLPRHVSASLLHSGADYEALPSLDLQTLPERPAAPAGACKTPAAVGATTADLEPQALAAGEKGGGPSTCRGALLIGLPAPLHPVLSVRLLGGRIAVGACALRPEPTRPIVCRAGQFAGAPRVGRHTHRAAHSARRRCRAAVAGGGREALSSGPVAAGEAAHRVLLSLARAGGRPCCEHTCQCFLQIG